MHVFACVHGLSTRIIEPHMHVGLVKAEICRKAMKTLVKLI